MIFLDTSFLYPLFNVEDDDHARVREVFESFRGRRLNELLVTTPQVIFETITQLHKEGTTILLVEQNARMALQVADRGYVLQSGEVVLSDSAEKLRANESVQKAYLGIT